MIFAEQGAARSSCRARRFGRLGRLAGPRLRRGVVSRTFRSRFSVCHGETALEAASRL